MAFTGTLFGAAERNLLSMSQGYISGPDPVMDAYDQIYTLIPQEDHQTFRDRAQRLHTSLRQSRKYQLGPRFVDLMLDVSEAFNRGTLSPVHQLSLPPFDICWVEWIGAVHHVRDDHIVPARCGVLVERIADQPEIAQHFHHPDDPDNPGQYAIHSFLDPQFDSIADSRRIPVAPGILAVVTHLNPAVPLPMGSTMVSWLSGLGAMYRSIRELTDNPAALAEFEEIWKYGRECSLTFFSQVVAIMGLLSTHILDKVVSLSPGKLPGHYLGKGKFSPPYRYNLVDLIRPMDLPMLYHILKPLVPRSGAIPLHDVSGAWHHRIANDQCPVKSAVQCPIAAWKPVLDDDGQPVGSRQSRCMVCGRLRWYQQAHQRGNAAAGIVDKDYRVKFDKNDTIT